MDVAEAVARAGVRVSVLQASSYWEKLSRDGVEYHFLPFGLSASTPEGRARFRELIGSLAPDVFHIHGLGFPRDVLALAPLAPATPILIQDHANPPPPIWRRPLWRRGLSVARGVAFCAREQARPFASAGLIQPHTAVYEIPESTTRFMPGDQAVARLTTHLTGNPGVLWVGHLNDNKDPLTVLTAVSQAAQHLPELQLWCCFGTAPLLSEVRYRIDTDPQLSSRVHLLGRVPHEKVEYLMRAADLFVLGSHREGSGYSVIEALACGLPPLVTDIPSFRSLTGGGAVGRLWPCGDAERLSLALVEWATKPRAPLREAARAQFEKELSFDAVGRKLRAAYHDLIGRDPASRHGRTS